MLFILHTHSSEDVKLIDFVEFKVHELFLLSDEDFLIQGDPILNENLPEFFSPLEIGVVHIEVRSCTIAQFQMGHHLVVEVLGEVQFIDVNQGHIFTQEGFTPHPSRKNGTCKRRDDNTSERPFRINLGIVEIERIAYFVVHVVLDNQNFHGVPHLVSGRFPVFPK